MKIIEQTKEPVVAVRKVQKSIHYSISVIGTKEDLERWKVDQAIKETEWQKAQEKHREARRERAMDVVSGEAAAMSLTDAELAEIEYVKRRKDTAKLERAAEAMSKYPKALSTYRGYEETMGVEKAAEAADEIAQKHESIFSFQAFKNICAKVWRNAFDSERD